MKTSEKISINPEKVIKNDELVNLRGGYDTGTCGWDGNGGEYDVACGYPKETVIAMASSLGGKWCCDSCSSTWYCGEYFS